MQEGGEWAPNPDACWLGSEAWYEGNLRAMLRCVDLSRGLLETPGPTGNILMQLKITALMNTRLCVRDRRGGGGGRGGCPPGPPHTPPTTPFQKELTSRVRRPGGSLELSPERLAEAMDSGRVRTSGWGRLNGWWGMWGKQSPLDLEVAGTRKRHVQNI